MFCDMLSWTVASVESTPEESFIKGWRFLERLPLQTIMAKDDQCNLLTFDQIKQLLRTGTQLLLVVINRPLLPIRSKKALEDHCIDGQEH